MHDNPANHAQKASKSSIQMVNLCSTKQVVGWFRQGKMDEAYLAFITPIKNEVQKIVPTVQEKLAKECNVEKAYHKDTPEQIKAVLQEYKDTFPMDFPLGLPLVRIGREFKIELEDDTPPMHTPIY